MARRLKDQARELTERQGDHARRGLQLLAVSTTASRQAWHREALELFEERRDLDRRFDRADARRASRGRDRACGQEQG